MPKRSGLAVAALFLASGVASAQLPSAPGKSAAAAAQGVAPLNGLLGVWANGEEAVEIRRSGAGSNFFIAWESPWGGDRYSLVHNQAVNALLTTGSTGVRERVDVRSDDIAITYIDGRRVRFSATGDKLTKTVEVLAPPRPRTGPGIYLPVERWNLVRSTSLKRTNAADPFARFDNRNRIADLSMWNTGRDLAGQIAALASGYRYGTQDRKAAIRAFAFAVDRDRVTLATYDDRNGIQWVARYRRIDGQRVLPLIDVTTSPYATMPVIPGPLEILPSGGWRLGDDPRSPAYGMNAHRTVHTVRRAGAVAQTLRFDKTKGWVDGPRALYAVSGLDGDWAALSATHMSKALADRAEDIRIAADDRRRARATDRRRAALAPPPAWVTSPAANPLFASPSTQVTLADGSTWSAAAQEEVERYKVREQLYRPAGGGASSTGGQPYARAYEQLARDRGDGGAQREERREAPRAPTNDAVVAQPAAVAATPAPAPTAPSARTSDGGIRVSNGQPSPAALKAAADEKARIAAADEHNRLAEIERKRIEDKMARENAEFQRRINSNDKGTEACRRAAANVGNGKKGGAVCR